MKIAILSTTKLPKFLGDSHPSEDALFAEDDILAKAFEARGAAARRVSWRQEDVLWEEFDLVMIRSTWDYIDDLPRFLAVLGDIVESGCRLVNPLKTVEWNKDKRYLATLGAMGLPIVPTSIVLPDQSPDAVLKDIAPSQSGYIIKPVMGVGAFGTKRLADKSALAAELTVGKTSGPQVIQPFLTSVVDEGEWSFVFGGGQFLYAALKRPRTGDFRVQVMYGAATFARTPTAADLTDAKRCYQGLPVTAHIARIDMARLPSGRLALMEAELIEPQLFFFDVPGAADLVAQAALGLTDKR